MDLDAAVAALAEVIAAAVARRLAPTIHETLAVGGGQGVAHIPIRRREAPPRTAYTVSEAAESLGISPRQVYRLADTGQLRTTTIGRRRLVPADALREFIAGA